MAETKEGLRDKLIIAAVQTALFGVLLAYLTFRLDGRLETYKQELAEQTEGVKALVQHYAPVMRQREAAYLELRQAARRVVAAVESYYFGGRPPITRLSATGKVRGVEYRLGLGSGSTGGAVPEEEDIVRALGRLAAVLDDHHDALSETVRAVADDFVDTTIEVIGKAGQPEHQAGDLRGAAHAQLREVFDRLNGVIQRALRLDELPIR